MNVTIPSNGLEIGRRISFGVYRASRGDRQFVVKHTHHLNSLIKREINMLNIVRSNAPAHVLTSLPEIVDYFQFGITTSSKKIKNECVVFNFIQGVDLYRYLSFKFPLEQSLIKIIFLQVCEIVKYIHSINVVHRDIKLENIIFDQEEKKCSLIDWEFSDVFPISEKNQRGSLSYAAPELVDSEHIGPENDVWALGIVLYTLLTYRNPYDVYDSDAVSTLIRKMKKLEINFDHLKPFPEAEKLLKKIFVHYMDRIDVATLCEEAKVRL